MSLAILLSRRSLTTILLGRHPHQPGISSAFNLTIERTTHIARAYDISNLNDCSSGLSSSCTLPPPLLQIPKGYTTWTSKSTKSYKETDLIGGAVHLHGQIIKD
ncbi:uncharacterized protein LOC122033847 [Zingiber officinale]|uniref:uncharacterized protein LOC122033847 n=1 Tax=Zingiber officinale TaxID=94328 RepID=UPI001C4D8E05|nr:uncharacterized protein LOC122033847 [Zingiber officinale]